MMFIVTSLRQIISFYKSGYSTHVKLRPLLLANQLPVQISAWKSDLLMMLIWCDHDP